MPKRNNEIKKGNKRIKTCPQFLIIDGFIKKDITKIPEEIIRLEKLKIVEIAIKRSTKKNFSRTCCLAKKSCCVNFRYFQRVAGFLLMYPFLPHLQSH